MKYIRYALLLMVICILCNNTMAQDDTANTEQAYNKGDQILAAGVSFLNYNWYVLGGRSTIVPPVQLSYEYGFDKYFSGGGFFGFGRWKYNYSGIFTGIGYEEYDYTFTQFSFGAKGTFHAVPFLNEEFDSDIDAQKWDFYGTVYIGGRVGITSIDENNIIEEDNSFVFLLNPAIGSRYKLNKNLGFFIEGGRGAFGYITLGISGHL